MIGRVLLAAVVALVCAGLAFLVSAPWYLCLVVAWSTFAIALLVLGEMGWGSEPSLDTLLDEMDPGDVLR